MTKTKPVMTTREACEYLDVSAPTLRACRKYRGLPAARVGKEYRYQRARIDEWLDSQAEQPIDEPQTPAPLDVDMSSKRATIGHGSIDSNPLEAN